MNFHILTIFPELIEPFLKLGLVGRANSNGLISTSITQLRDFAINSQGQIDDTPYGGGSGMVLRAEPVAAAIRSLKKQSPNAKVIHFSPRGKPLTQDLLKSSFLKPFSAKNNSDSLILLCSRYEGVDQRALDEFVDMEISLGDYVLMGGELPAMAFIESLTRLLPGVLGNPESILEESFEHNLLEHPQFTKPQEFEGKSVPEVLLSGNHQAIAGWREKERLRVTKERRPDLLPPNASTEISATAPKEELSVALVHAPVVDKQGAIITSSITNLDVHDISRTVTTYGTSKLYIVHPTKTLRRLIQRICEHWDTGFGATYNPNRREALAKVSLVPDLDDAILDIKERTGKLPRLITTSAKSGSNRLNFSDARTAIMTDDTPHLLLLGTGWGLAEEVIERSDYLLEPIVGPTDYNHLSVRSAAAIMLDRLLKPEL